MNSERRSIRRERPEELSYIQFEPEGGGIVLNASERGVAFHAATAVRQPGQVRLSISPNPKELIGLTAEIVWMDQTKRSGGLRFVELTEDTRNQISRWLTETGETETPDIKPELLSRVQAEDTDSYLGPRNSKRCPQEPTAARCDALPADVDNPSAPRSFGFPTAALWPAPFSEEKQASSSRAGLLRGLATGFLVLVFVSMPILFSQDFRSVRRFTDPHWGETEKQKPFLTGSLFLESCSGVRPERGVEVICPQTEAGYSTRGDAKSGRRTCSHRDKSANSRPSGAKPCTPPEFSTAFCGPAF
jgi:hypothetical protein